jgi:hypothetical protein
VFGEKRKILMQQGLPAREQDVPNALAVEDLQGPEGFFALHEAPIGAWKLVQGKIAEAAFGVTGVVDGELAEPGSAFFEDETERPS